MVLEPEQFKKPDGTIDWGKYSLTRLKALEEKEKAKNSKNQKALKATKTSLSINRP